MLKTILKNFFSLLSSQIITRLISFGVIIALSRELGVEKFGQYSFVLAFVALFSIVADLGISQLVIREVSKDKTQSQKYLANFFIIQIFLSVLIFILIVLVINLLGYTPEMKQLVYIAGLGTVAISVGMPFGAILNAYEKMHYGALVAIATNIINAALILISIYFNLGLKFVVGATTVANIANALLVYWFYQKIKSSEVQAGKGAAVFDRSLIKNLLYLAFPFALLMGFNTLYNRIDMTMLSKMQGDAAVGYYSAAYRIINFLSFLPSSFSTAIFPLLSRVASQSKSENDNSSFIINKSLKYIIALGVPIAAGVSILATPIIQLLYGEEYLASSTALRILVWMVVVLCFYSVVTFALIAKGKVMAFALTNGVGVIVNIGLNLYFIPRWGFVGASWTTIISEAVILTISYYLAHRYLDYREPFGAVAKILFAGLLMGLLTFSLQKSGINLIINVLASGILYLAILWLLKFIEPDEKAILNKIIYKSNG